MFLALLGRSSPDAEEESGLGCCAHHLEDLVMTLGVSAVEESYHVIPELEENYHPHKNFHIENDPEDYSEQEMHQ